MISCEDLEALYNHGELARFWVEIASKDHDFVCECARHGGFAEEVQLKIKFFGNLQNMQFGIAPNEDQTSELVQMFALEQLNVRTVNLSALTSPETPSTQSTGYSQEKVKNQVLSVLSKDFDESNLHVFIEVVFQRIETNLVRFCQIFKASEGFNDEFVLQTQVQLLEIICRFLLNQNDQGSSKFVDFICKGYVFTQVESVVYVFYNHPARKKYLENIVFGCAQTIYLKNLMADVVIEHKNGQISEFHFVEDREITLNLRSSDKLLLAFTNDAGFRNAEDLGELAKIPCNIDIDFKKSKHVVRADSLRVKDRNERLHKLLDQLTSLIPEKITSLSFVNVGEAVNSETLNFVRHMRNLLSVNLAGCKISTADFKDYHEFKRLRNLDLSGIVVDQSRTDFFKKFPMVRRLRCSDTPDIVEFLGNQEILPRFEILDLSANSINAQNSMNLLKMNQLHELNLANSDFTDMNFTFLRNFPSLTSMELRNCQLKTDSIRSLCDNVQNLKHLDVSTSSIDMALTSSDFLPITQIETLEQLNIANRMIDDEFLRALSLNAKKLNFLNASFSIVTDYGFTNLINLKSMKTLNLAGCRQISDNGLLQLLNNLYRIKNLDIRGTSISQECAIIIMDKFPAIKLSSDLIGRRN